MAATLAQIRSGLADNLATLNNVQISAYMLANPTPPTLQVMGPDVVTYDLAMARGLDSWTLIIQGFVGAVTDIGSQTLLDEWLAPNGATSVKQALESSKTLGGIVQNVRVTSSAGYQRYRLDNLGEVLGSEWTVQIFNAGN